MSMKVFLSSTYLDLIEYRKAAHEALERIGQEVTSKDEHQLPVPPRRRDFHAPAFAVVAVRAENAGGDREEDSRKQSVESSAFPILYSSTPYSSWMYNFGRKKS
jgi:hypothetical protein